MTAFSFVKCKYTYILTRPCFLTNFNEFRTLFCGLLLQESHEKWPHKILEMMKFEKKKFQVPIVVLILRKVVYRGRLY